MAGSRVRLRVFSRGTGQSRKRSSLPSWAKGPCSIAKATQTRRHRRSPRASSSALAPSQMSRSQRRVHHSGGEGAAPCPPPRRPTMDSPSPPLNRLSR
eukprot:3741255-Lingulodinium_polyedra.AAC.1